MADFLGIKNDLSARGRPLYEKYRPRAWGDVIGQDKALAKLAEIAPRLSGNAYWISGPSGTGKTTIAKLLAAEIADDFFVLEYDAAEFGVDTFRETVDSFQLTAWGKGGRVCVVNEAHRLRKDVITRLLEALEKIPSHCAWIFTTTNAGQQDFLDGQLDANPLLSRCVEIPMQQRNLCQQFAARAQTIALAEGLDGRPLAQYVKLVQEHRNNFRRVLQDISSGRMKKE